MLKPRILNRKGAKYAKFAISRRDKAVSFREESKNLIVFFSG